MRLIYFVDLENLAKHPFLALVAMMTKYEMLLVSMEQNLDFHMSNLNMYISLN